MSAVLDALVLLNGRMTNMIGQTYAAFHHDRKIGLVEARLNIRSARKAAQEIVAALTAAELELDAAIPSNVTDINAAPASLRPVGEIAKGAVGRLVPRATPIDAAE